jgi:hypothetical protein
MLLTGSEFTITHFLSRKIPLNALPAVRLDPAFLSSVRSSLNHFTTPCLRDSLMLMLASGRNAI